jgi:formylglycine-generating enzyme required for sulfatase activity
MKHILTSLLAILVLAGCSNPAGHDTKGGGGRPASKIYSVNIDPALSNGTIIAKPASGPAGTEIFLQMSPVTGYKLTDDSLAYSGNVSGTVVLKGSARSFILPQCDVQVTGKFEPLGSNNHSVSFVPGPDTHGLIISNPEFGTAGTNVHFFPIPDEGYRYIPGTLKVDGVSINDITRTFVLPNASIKVDAEFETLPKGSYSVRVNGSGNGRIFAIPEYGPEGTEVFLQVIANPGYVLDTGTLKYRELQVETTINETLKSFKIPKNHVVVSGEFKQLPAGTFSVGIENLANGHIATESATGNQGASITLRVYPEPGYILRPGTLEYKDSSGREYGIDEKALTFTMPADNVMVYGEFIALKPNTFSIQVGKYSSGKIIAFPEFAEKNTNVFLLVQADAGFQLKPGSLYYVDSSGKETRVNDDSSFTLPTSHVRIKAEFEPLSANIFSIQPGTTPNGRVVPKPDKGKEFTPVTLWVTPEPGYRYEPRSLKYKLIPANVEVSVPDDNRTFSLPASHVQVFASFIKVQNNAHTIQVAITDHGTIVPVRDYGSNNEYIQLTIKPEPGYRLKQGSLQYKDTANNIKQLPNVNGFSMPADHVVLSAEFETVNYTANIDSGIRNGRIATSVSQGIIGTPVKLTITPENGYRMVPNSLKYKFTNNDQGTPINETTREFSMPGNNLTITAQFEKFSALKDLKVNNQPVTTTDGTTAYTVWIPRQKDEAEFTFTVDTGAEAKPGSGEKKALKVLEKTPVVFTVTAPNGIDTTTYTITTVRELIPTETVSAGSFQRDNNSSNLSKISAFRMGTYAVTQEEWEKIMVFDRGTEGKTYPAHSVNWYEAVVFCNKLSILEGKTPAYMMNNSTNPDTWGTKIPDLVDSPWSISCKWDVNGYRLPTEMEWQWAAMGADSRLQGRTNTTGYGYPFAGSEKYTLDEAAWHKDNSGGSIHPVGEKKPNELGLYDMSGNVMEWCWDWLGSNYSATYNITGIQDNPRGWDNTTNSKMRRGGCYSSEEPALFINYRGVANSPATDPQPVQDPRNNDPYVGFRIVYRN